MFSISKSNLSVPEEYKKYHRKFPTFFNIFTEKTINAFSSKKDKMKREKQLQKLINEIKNCESEGKDKCNKNVLLNKKKEFLSLFFVYDLLRKNTDHTEIGQTKQKKKDIEIIKNFIKKSKNNKYYGVKYEYETVVGNYVSKLMTKAKKELKTLNFMLFDESTIEYINQAKEGKLTQKMIDEQKKQTKNTNDKQTEQHKLNAMKFAKQLQDMFQKIEKKKHDEIFDDLIEFLTSNTTSDFDGNLFYVIYRHKYLSKKNYDELKNKHIYAMKILEPVFKSHIEKS
jgi:D-mannonate dehydratase